MNQNDTYIYIYIYGETDEHDIKNMINKTWWMVWTRQSAPHRREPWWMMSLSQCRTWQVGPSSEQECEQSLPQQWYHNPKPGRLSLLPPDSKHRGAWVSPHARRISLSKHQQFPGHLSFWNYRWGDFPIWTVPSCQPRNSRKPFQSWISLINKLMCTILPHQNLGQNWVSMSSWCIWCLDATKWNHENPWITTGESQNAYVRPQSANLYTLNNWISSVFN